ncbi:hypothetical protein LJC32_04880, partial [Oscillospiraceae bacterium OttesenSCG-928-F05]|nr:hypothetical protein [Oscillospiraceae bacterium OttesenSCG-928-F05]
MIEKLRMWSMLLLPPSALFAHIKNIISEFREKKSYLQKIVFGASGQIGRNFLEFLPICLFAYFGTYIRIFYGISIYFRLIYVFCLYIFIFE